MTQIKSSLGVQTFKNQSRVLEIPDVEDDSMLDNPNLNSNVNSNANANANVNNFKNEIHKIKNKEEEFNSRKNLIKGKESLSNGALDRIAMLIGLMQVQRSVVIDEVVFVLRSLKNYEYREVITAGAKSNALDQVFELTVQTLARSLVSVTDISIENYLGSDTLESRILFVENLDKSVVARLYNEYLILNKEVEEKYKIKTDSDAKEVINDLKK